MAFIVTGIAELEATFKAVGDKVSSRASRRAVQYTGQLIAREARAAAPAGKTRRLRKSVRFKWERRYRKGPITAGKVTVGSPHGHLITMGTAERERFSIGGWRKWRGTGPDPRKKRTGRVRATHFLFSLIQANDARYTRILTAQLKRFVGEEFDKASSTRS